MRQLSMFPACYHESSQHPFISVMHYLDNLFRRRLEKKNRLEGLVRDLAMVQRRFSHWKWLIMGFQFEFKRVVL